MNFLIKHWRVGLLAASIAAAWGTMVHMRNTIDNLRQEVDAAETAEAQARATAATERANATALAERLKREQADRRAEREARTAAEEERDRLLAASEDRSDSLRDTIIVERDRDPTLDQCLRLDLPDSVVRQLPFGAGGAGPDNR